MVHLRPAAEPLPAEWEDPVVQERLRSLERLRVYAGRRDQETVQQTAALHAHYRGRLHNEKTLDAPAVERLLVRGIEGALAAHAKAADAASTDTATPACGETVEAYSVRWLAARESRVNSIRDDRSRLRDHVLPIVGALDVATFTRDDVENVRDALDAKIASGALSWKTARNVWATFTKLCDDATNAKLRRLRVRSDNPAAGVKAPDRGAKKAKQYLFPSELLALVACEDVPLSWRRSVAVAVYTYLRDGELRELRWEDVDLQHARIEVSHAFNRRTRKSKAPKTAAGNRTVPIEPTLLPLLRAMHAECKGEGLVVKLGNVRKMAERLRSLLRRAGVTRDALYEASTTRKPLTWHDLRATGTTWLAVRGDPLQVIQRRAGHESMETTMGYVREAESFAGNAFGVPFPELPSSLLGDAGANPSTVVSAGSAKTVDGTRGGVDGTRTRGLRRDRPAL